MHASTSTKRSLRSSIQKNTNHLNNTKNQKKQQNSSQSTPISTPTRQKASPRFSSHRTFAQQGGDARTRQQQLQRQQQLKQQASQLQKQPQQQQPTVKRVHQQRLAKTGIVGAGPTGLTVARVSQVMGFQSPITLIDNVAPARVDVRNNKRNHPLLLSSLSMDSLSQIDPKLYRRLLSLGRFDTYAGYLDWNDTPTKLLAPKEDPNNIFPRWINHLCLPRDAYAFAILTTPLFDLPQSYKDLMKKALNDPTMEVPALPQVGINIGQIVEMTTPLQDPRYSQTYVPIIKLTPKAVRDARNKIKSLQDEDVLEGLLKKEKGGLFAESFDENNENNNNNNNQNDPNNSPQGNSRGNRDFSDLDNDHDDNGDDGLGPQHFKSKSTPNDPKSWQSARGMIKKGENDQSEPKKSKLTPFSDDEGQYGSWGDNNDNKNSTYTRSIRNNNKNEKNNTNPSNNDTRDKRLKEARELLHSSEKLQKALEFNAVIAADGLTSDLYKLQHRTPHNYTRLLPSPNDNVRVHGWTRASELKYMIGETIGDVTFDHFDEVYRRVNSRIFTRKTEGIRFTSVLMDYAPLHLTNDVTYRPKEANDLPDWVYWELLVAEKIWKSQTNLPTPLLPATNNPEIEFQRNENFGGGYKGGLDHGVMMFHGDPIHPKDLLQIGQLAAHPLIKTLISRAEPPGLTVERSMYTPMSNLHRSTFHDHVIYSGSAAFGNISDSLSSDTLNMDHAIILALTLAANGSTQGPEFMARQVGTTVDKSFFNRANVVQRKVLEESIYHGETNKASQYIGKMVEKYFPPVNRGLEYEQLYRFNALKSYESAAADAISTILQRNKTYRDSVLQGFLDGETRKIDFGDIPLRDIDLGFNPRMREADSVYLSRNGGNMKR